MGASQGSCSACAGEKDSELTLGYSGLHEDAVAPRSTRDRDDGKQLAGSPSMPKAAQGLLAGCTRPELPTCDVTSLPRGCLPEQMAGLSDQECADVLLAQASVRGELQDVQRALGQGASVDTRAELCIAMGDLSGKKPRKLTPLMRACSAGHSEVVEMLLAANASLWRADADGWTPLCHALGAGELMLARQLLVAAGPHSERQKGIARAKQAQVMDALEDNEAAEAVREEFESGFLSQSSEEKKAEAALPRKV
eukprot:TRINITY_DN12857_c0_g1_i1.p1 TRINITY_DN12857_c0_g1~~TRINITY_DN12857_c0_g1_i1.p1  ORF type:complete len:253 (-),score=59.11 TRINITY_DN12857_c0_g1_i1:169-927(-)